MNKLETLFKYITISLMTFIIFIVTLQIIARELVYIPINWTHDAAKYAFIWMSLLGAAVGIRKASHVSIDVLSAKLPKRFQRYLDYIVHASVAILMIVFLVLSLKFTLQTVGQTSPTLGISMSYIYLSLVIFSLLGLVFSVEKIFKLPR